MYFLEQIKRQSNLFIIQYLEWPDAAINQVWEQQAAAPEVDEWPKGPDEVIARAQQVNSGTDKAVAAELERGLVDWWIDSETSSPWESEIVKWDVSKASEEAGEASAETELSNAEFLKNMWDSPLLEWVSPEDREALLTQIEETWLEIPEGMTRQEALQAALNDALTDPEALTEQGYEWIAGLNNTMDSEMLGGLIDHYGKERLDALSEIYAEMASEEWFEAPESVEAFNELMEAAIAERERVGLESDDPGSSPDDWALANAARQVISGGSAWQLRSYNNSGWRVPGNAPELAPGNAEATRAQLDTAISEAPTEKARQLLTTAGEFLGKNETTHRAELHDFLGFDPTQTPWCKGFTNKCGEASWIELNSSGSLFSLSWVNDGRALWSNEEPLPWDVVMVRRDGGGHIWFYVWTAPSGDPIIIWWNQGSTWWGEVSIKVESRELVGINRIWWEPTVWMA